MKRISVFVFVFCLVFATASWSQKPSTPPAVTDAQKAKLFKALYQSTLAQLTLQQAQTDLQTKSKATEETIQDLMKSGGDYALQWDASGDPVFVEKPKSDKK